MKWTAKFDETGFVSIDPDTPKPAPIWRKRCVIFMKESFNRKTTRRLRTNDRRSLH